MAAVNDASRLPAAPRRRLDPDVVVGLACTIGMALLALLFALEGTVL